MEMENTLKQNIRRRNTHNGKKIHQHNIQRKKRKNELKNLFRKRQKNYSQNQGKIFLSKTKKLRDNYFFKSPAPNPLLMKKKHTKKT